MPGSVKWFAALAAFAAIAAAAVLLDSGDGPPPATPPPEQPPAPGPETSALEGRAVRRGTKEPLAVRVAAFLPDGGVFRTVAGPDGSFRLEGLPRGRRVHVEVSFPGLGSVRWPALPVPAEGVLELPPSSLGPSRRIAVGVRGADGAPVPGAVVRVLQPPAAIPSLPEAWDPGAQWPEVARSTTDREGRAQFQDFSAGAYRVQAEASGRAAAATRLLVRDGVDPGSSDIVLREGVGLEVAVQDAAGRPVEGARARAEWGEAVVESGPAEGGVCRLEGLERGSLRITALLPSGVAFGGGLVSVPAPGKFPLVLEETTFLRGRVRDAESGAGIRGASVSICRAVGSGDPRDASARTTTGPDGLFEFPVFPGKPLMILAVARGHLDRQWRVGHDRPDALPPDGPYDLPLRAGRTIRGTLRGEDGSSVPDAMVHLAQSREGGGYAIGPGSMVRPDGTFDLGGARPGPAMVKATAPGWWQPDFPSAMGLPAALAQDPPPACSVVVPEKGEATLDLVLRRGGTVSGVLRDGGGRPQGNLQLHVGGAAGPPLGWAMTGEDGSFAVHGLPPGTGYVVSVFRGGAPVPATPRFDLADGASATGLRLTVPPGLRVHGVVLDPEGRPAGGATVRVLPGPARAFPGGGEAGSPFPSAVTAADGTFRIDTLPAVPSQTAVGSRPGSAAAEVVLENLRDGEDRGPVEIRLAAESPFAGVVVDEAGRPVPGARITAGPSRDGGTPPLGSFHSGAGATVRAVSGADGRFTVGGLAAGPRVAGAAAAGYLPDARAVEGDEVRLVLVRPRGIGGVVREKGTGLPVAGAEVSAGERAFTDREGRFRIEGLRPGTHDLRVSHPGPWLPVDPVRAEAGGADVAFELEKGLPIAGRVLDEDGRPVEHAQVWFGPAGGRPADSMQAGLDGSFRSPSLRAGSYDLGARPAGWGRGPAATGSLMPGQVEDVQAGREDVEIRLGVGLAIRGRVVDETGSADLSRLRVLAVPPWWSSPKPWERGGATYQANDVPSVSPEPDGTFHFPALDRRLGWDLLLKGRERSGEEGRPSAADRMKGGVGGVLRRVSPGTDGAVLLLDPGRSIRGRVLDPGGAPIRGIQVRALALEVRGLEDGTRAEARADEKGEFTLDRLGLFRFRVSVRTGDSRWAPAALEAAAAEGAALEFRLLPGASIEGRVESAGVEKLYVRSVPAEGVEGEELTARVREDGTFSLHGLAPGPHRLHVGISNSKAALQDGGTVLAPATGLTLRWR